MSFGFTAVGSKAEVIAQCRSHNIDHGGDLAIAVRNLIVEALENDLSDPGPSWRYAYVVKAGGHGNNGAGPGSSPTSLSLTIETQYVPEVAEVAVAEAVEIAEEEVGEIDT
jgi:hypothetical protein